MTNITARRVTDPAELHLLRLEMTAEFVKHNIAHLNDEGLDDDPYYGHSDIYGAYDDEGNAVGGCRLIRWNGKPLPAFGYAPIYVEEQDMLSGLDETRIAEVGRLVSFKGRKHAKNFAVTAALYQAMWQDVVKEQQIDYFVAFTMPTLYRRLERLNVYFKDFTDPVASEKCADETLRQGAILDLRAAYLDLKNNNPDFLALMADGLDESVLNAYDRYCTQSLVVAA